MTGSLRGRSCGPTTDWGRGQQNRGEVRRRISGRARGVGGEAMLNGAFIASRTAIILAVRSLDTIDYCEITARMGSNAFVVVVKD